MSARSTGAAGGRQGSPDHAAGVRCPIAAGLHPDAKTPVGILWLTAARRDRPLPG
jgi:hypothetical protein